MVKGPSASRAEEVSFKSKRTPHTATMDGPALGYIPGERWGSVEDAITAGEESEDWEARIRERTFI